MGQPIVIVNTLSAAFEIFERRSSKFSDRSDMVLTNDLMGQTWNFGFMRYGDKWREHRKLFHAHYQPKAVEKYTPIQTRAARQMLDALLQTPEEFMDHIAFFTGYIILNITYGYRPKDRQDYYVRLSELAQELLNEVSHQTWLVEIFPTLKKLPLWFPGTYIQNYAKNARAVNASVLKEPYDRALEDMVRLDLSFTMELRHIYVSSCPV
jgi:cytochrome P450